MTTKTKVLFLFIVGVAGIAIAGLLLLENQQVFTLPTRGGVSVDLTVAVAPSLEDWARDAVADFNRKNAQISVTIVSLDGLDARQKLDSSQGEDLPDAWIAEADFVRQMLYGVPFDETGPSMAQTDLLWLGVLNRPETPVPADWPSVHDAAVNNPQFQAALPSPANSVTGVAAYLSAAAAYHNTPALNRNLVSDAGFIGWLDEILIAVPNKTGSVINQLSRPPVSVDAGLILQSDLIELNAAQFQPNAPQYNVNLNFPYLIRRQGLTPDATDREQAAEAFRAFLLDAAQQQLLAEYGLNPAGTPVSGQEVQVDGDMANSVHSRNW